MKMPGKCHVQVHTTPSPLPCLHSYAPWKSPANQAVSWQPHWPMVGSAPSQARLCWALKQCVAPSASCTPAACTTSQANSPSMWVLWASSPLATSLVPKRDDDTDILKADRGKLIPTAHPLIQLPTRQLGKELSDTSSPSNLQTCCCTYCSVLYCSVPLCLALSLPQLKALFLSLYLMGPSSSLYYHSYFFPSVLPQAMMLLLWFLSASLLT